MLDLPVAEIQRAATMGQPAHDHLVATDDLHAIDAEILTLFIGAAGDHQRPGHQRADIARPAGLHGQDAKVDIRFVDDDVATGRRFFQIRRDVEHLAICGQVLPQLLPAFGWNGFFQEGEKVPHISQTLQVLLAHGQRHASRMSEQIAEQGNP